MHRIRTPGYRKTDPAQRWALPDRVFFACGACHILAHAFLERFGMPEDDVLWIKPASGYAGNHIFVARSGWVFDFHGYSDRGRFLQHSWTRACRLWPGWTGTLVPLPREVLMGEARAIDGLWLRRPSEYLHDPLPRARRFLDRFPSP